MRRPPRHSAVPNLSSLRVTRFLSFSLSLSAAFGTFRHVPTGTSGGSHEPNCDQRGLHLGDPGGVRRCVHRRSPGSATRHPRWMETSLRPLAARPRRSTARAHPDHTPTTPRPRPDLAGLLAMRPRISRVRPADARSSHVLPRLVRVPCGSSTGCEVDRIREDRGRPGTPDGGVHVHLTRAHLR